MKSLLKKYVFLVVSVWVVSSVVTGFKISGGLVSYMVIAFALSCANLIIRPILKLIFLPINMVTFGLFSIIINAIILYIIALFIPQMSFVPWTFGPASFLGILYIPAIEFGIIATYVLTAFLLSVVTTFLNKIS